MNFTGRITGQEDSQRMKRIKLCKEKLLIIGLILKKAKTLSSLMMKRLKFTLMKKLPSKSSVGMEVKEEGEISQSKWKIRKIACKTL